MISWTGIYAPAEVANEIISRLSLEIAHSLQKPDVRAKFAAFGMEPVGSTPEEFARFTRSEIYKWSVIVKAAGIAPE